MAITSLTQQRNGNVVTLTAVSGLSGTVYFHWYSDGVYLGKTLTGVYALLVDVDDQARIDVTDTNNAAYDPIANAPAGYPARRLLWFIRSTDSDVGSYRIEMTKDAEAAVDIGAIQQADEWSHAFLTARLVDLSSYAFAFYPVDAAGNEGTALSLSAETLVRTPDAPDFDIAFDEGTTRVTFSEAA